MSAEREAIAAMAKEAGLEQAVDLEFRGNYESMTEPEKASFDAITRFSALVEARQQQRVLDRLAQGFGAGSAPVSVMRRFFETGQ